YRVLLIASYHNFSDIDNDSIIPQTIGVILISDPLREDAASTITFFDNNDVKVKIISGDNPITVNALARQAGFKSANHYLDATTLKEEDLEQAIIEYDIIGRASPKQKHLMILALQNQGHTVAMTGDGVNDVLALKDADVSIAMNSGSDITKQVAHVVVMDENLQTLVDIVKEGRQVINSVTRSASMYYLKTLYTIGLSLLAIILNIPFPFIPFQITLMDMFISGFPSFMLVFEANITKPKESISDHALRYSLPNATAIIFMVALVTLLAPMLKLNINQVFTIIYFSTAFISLHLIYRIYRPLNKYRALVLLIDVIGFIIAVLVFWNLLELSTVTTYLFKLIILVILLSIPILIII
ncbi:MAG: HAD-IC family P-type ATPase, partial [Bacilli bacterium]